MCNPLPIVVPREIVNDDVVKIVQWHAPPGGFVRQGQTIVEIETSKATIALEAERDGYLEPLCAEGQEVAVGEVVARLNPKPPGDTFAPAQDARCVQTPGANGQRISRKAEKLIAVKGLNPAQFAALPVVREADVVRHLNEQEGTERRETSSVPCGPLPDQPDINLGPLDDLRTAAEDRGRSLIWVVCNYFFRNYLLGLMVRVAPRGIILLLHRLRGVKLGKHCFIDPSAVIETAYPENIGIGNDVRIAAHAVIMTHIKPPHYLRRIGAVPVVLKKVVLEDHCFIGVNAVIMPGVTVGRAAVVASGAVVVSDVPAFTMVSGNPARVIKRFPIPGQPEA